MRRMHVAIAALGLLALRTAPLFAQTGSVQGRVTDSTGTALPRATVTIEGTNLRIATDERGAFALRGVAAGRHTLQVRLIGYRPSSGPVDIPPGGAATANVTLSAAPIGLAAIDVVVGSRARHTAAEELAVPVDIFPAEQLAVQG
ncbi:MAG: carboxypeptidase-like regulatory domain-containing protein, partial [Gemmatimonadetes bacterium]|nr:carboxypeptidase-like regulatory domain-containing protein [Gemmatimonadota bacterium]